MLSIRNAKKKELKIIRNLNGCLNTQTENIKLNFTSFILNEKYSLVELCERQTRVKRKQMQFGVDNI